MLRSALRRARAATAARTQNLPNPKLTAAPPSRFFGTNGPDSPQNERVARQMIQYALGHARSQKSGDSYAQAMMILEQGLSNFRGGNSTDDAVGMIMLAMSTLLYERGEIQDAVEKLQMVHQLERASLALRVAAWESLVGLNLETGQDVTSSVLADDCFRLLNSSPEGSVPSVEALKSRAKALKGLASLVLGELNSAQSFFGASQDCKVEEHKYQMGNAALSNGEFLHATGNFSLAKEFYERIVRIFETEDTADSSCLASANMSPEEVLVGATCALGQLLAHSGEFRDAEDLLTKALTKAEHHFGLTHPKVGVVLTCMAMMFGRKAKLEASSSLLIQEGLYRRAIDLLKAPSLDSEVDEIQVARRDIVALARGGYAELLCIQQNRKGEGERMRKWAEAAWRNRRLSVAQAMEFSESSPAAVIDTRVSRVL